MKILLSCLLFLDLFVLLSCVSISVGLGTLHPSQLPTDFVTLVNVAILLGTSCTLLLSNVWHPFRIFKVLMVSLRSYATVSLFTVCGRTIGSSSSPTSYSSPSWWSPSSSSSWRTSFLRGWLQSCSSYPWLLVRNWIQKATFRIN